MGGGSADKASKVKSLLASYYDTDADAAAPPSLHDSPRPAPPLSPPSAAASRSLAPQLAGAGGSRERLDAAALNASYFDADAYLRRMLREARLAELAARQRDMAAEVGSLDSDMQMLVYENYSKFIAATDTIRLMSASMEGLDERMAHLRTLIDGVVAGSNAVNGKLERRQQEIEELSAVRALLHRLQGVFDLPRRLRAAIEREAFEVAADAYADAAPLLKQYGHKGAFKAVAAEVEGCGRELAGILRRRLLAQPDQAAECIQMIAKLGEPTESLQEDFLQCKRQRLEGMLAAAGLMVKTLAAQQGLLEAAEVGAEDEALRRRMAAMFLGEGGAGSSPSLHDVVVQLDGRFITEITHTAGLFAQLFPPGGRKRLVKMCRDCFTHYLKLTRRALSDASAIAAAAAAGITAAGQPLQPLGDLLAAAEGGAVAETVAADWGAAELLRGLYVVKTDLARLDSLLPELCPHDRGGELVEHTLRQHVSLCFAALERRLLGDVAALAAALAAAERDADADARRRLLCGGLAALQALMVAGLERLLRSLKEYERQEWVLAGWAEVFASSVHGQVSNLFLSTAQQLLAAALVAPPPTLAAAAVSSARSSVESAAPFAAVQRRDTAPVAGGGGGGGGGGDTAGQPPPPALLLLLSRLCGFAEQEAVGSALVLLQQLYPERLVSGGEELPAFLPTELGRQLAAAAGTLLHAYVAAHATPLAAAVEAATGDDAWAGVKEARAPRPICDHILDRVAAVDMEASFLLGDSDGAAPGGPRLPSGHSRGASAGSAASWDSSQVAHSRGPSRGGGPDAQGAYFEASVSRMLAGRDSRHTYGGGLEASRPSIRAALLAAALRALVAALRRQPLGRAALQQVQLDVHYMRPELQRWVAGAGDGPAVVQLLDEALAVALERCGQPLLLDSAAMDRLLAACAGGRSQPQSLSLL